MNQRADRCLMSEADRYASPHQVAGLLGARIALAQCDAPLGTHDGQLRDDQKRGPQLDGVSTSEVSRICGELDPLDRRQRATALRFRFTDSVTIVTNADIAETLSRPSSHSKTASRTS
jgi:hypothetical protein